MIAKSVRNYKRCEGEKNYKPSETVPDMAMSLREMLANHVHGLPIDQTGMNAVYDPDGELPDVKSLDLVEIHEMSTALQKRVVEIFEDLKEKRKLADDEEKEKEILERLRAKEIENINDESSEVKDE